MFPNGLGWERECWLCVVILVAWGSSTNETGAYWYENKHFALISPSGCFVIAKEPENFYVDSLLGSVAARLGFFLPHLQRYPANRWLLVIPYWLPFLLLAIPTTTLWYRDRCPPEDHCQHCGYNLTGHESGVCPECATPVAKPETTA